MTKVILNFLSKQRFLFLMLFLLTFFVSPRPLAENSPDMNIPFFIASMIPFIGVCLAGKSKRHFIISLALAITDFLLICNSKTLDLSPPIFIFIFPVLNYSFGIYIILLNVLKEDRVNGNTIYGAISVYLLLGFMWGILYNIIFKYNPASFFYSSDKVKSIPLIYYSFITLTTVGYGDIQPATCIARNLSMLEAIIGQFYLTVLIAILVGKYIISSMEKQEERIFTERFLRYILNLNEDEQKKLLEELNIKKEDERDS